MTLCLSQEDHKLIKRGKPPTCYKQLFNHFGQDFNPDLDLTSEQIIVRNRIINANPSIFERCTLMPQKYEKFDTFKKFYAEEIVTGEPNVDGRTVSRNKCGTLVTNLVRTVVERTFVMNSLTRKKSCVYSQEVLVFPMLVLGMCLENSSAVIDEANEGQRDFMIMLNGYRYVRNFCTRQFPNITWPLRGESSPKLHPGKIKEWLRLEDENNNVLIGNMVNAVGGDDRADCISGFVDATQRISDHYNPKTITRLKAQLVHEAELLKEKTELNAKQQKACEIMEAIQEQTVKIHELEEYGVANSLSPPNAMMGCETPSKEEAASALLAMQLLAATPSTTKRSGSESHSSGLAMQPLAATPSTTKRSGSESHSSGQNKRRIVAESTTGALYHVVIRGEAADMMSPSNTAFATTPTQALRRLIGVDDWAACSLASPDNSIGTVGTLEFVDRTQISPEDTYECCFYNHGSVDMFSDGVSTSGENSSYSIPSV